MLQEQAALLSRHTGTEVQSACNANTIVPRVSGLYESRQSEHGQVGASYRPVVSVWTRTRLSPKGEARAWSHTGGLGTSARSDARCAGQSQAALAVFVSCAGIDPPTTVLPRTAADKETVRTETGGAVGGSIRP
jgi:hypothetical protein